MQSHFNKMTSSIVSSSLSAQNCLAIFCTSLILSGQLLRGDGKLCFRCGLAQLILLLC